MLHAELRLADVEGPDGDAPGRGALDELAVGAVLRLFGQRRLARAGEQELGSEQADPFGAALDRAGRVVGRLDVRLEPDLHAVFGDGRQVAVLVERLLVGLPPPLPRLDLLERIGVGVDDDLSGRAVDGDDRAGGDEHAGVVQARDGRHAQRAREDRGVIRPAAGIRDQSGQPLPVELRDDRRRHVVRDEHQRPLEVPEEVGGIARLPQVHGQPADHVGDVALALAQIGILRLVEERGNVLERPLERGLGVQPFAADRVGRAPDEHRVVEHQQLRVEEIGVLGAGGGGDARLDLLDLLAGAHPGGVEPLELALDEPGGHAEPDVARAPFEDERLADADARRHAESGQAHGATSSNPRATSAHSAASACSSSAPVAEIVMRQPCAAASSSRPMMLLPSISRSPRATRIRELNPLAA